MRLLRLSILLWMTRPHGQTAESKPAQHRADAALGQGHIEPALDHAGQIHAPPAHHAICGRIRPCANQFGYDRLLLGGKPRFGTG